MQGQINFVWLSEYKKNDNIWWYILLDRSANSTVLPIILAKNNIKEQLKTLLSKMSSY